MPVCVMMCWEGEGQLFESREELLLQGEKTRHGGGYFHDPISIREAKLFMPSA